MDATVSEIAATYLPSILSGAVLIYIGVWQRKSERRENSRKKESILVLQNIDAIGTLAERTARCVKGEKLNGELDAAMEYRTRKKHELENHLLEVNAEMKNG